MRSKPQDQDHARLVFLTAAGEKWVTATVSEPDNETGRVKVKTHDAVCVQFNRLLDSLNLHRPGLGFYALRHGFETVAGDSRDQIAIDAVMGHTDDSMASVYRERIDDDRLVAVVEHVHEWLFGNVKQK